MRATRAMLIMLNLRHHHAYLLFSQNILYVFLFLRNFKISCPLLLLFTSLCLCENQKTPEGVYAECVGVSKNYVEWHWKVEQCIENKCVQERRTCSVKYTRRLV